MACANLWKDLERASCKEERPSSKHQHKHTHVNTQTNKHTHTTHREESAVLTYRASHGLVGQPGSHPLEERHGPQRQNATKPKKKKRKKGKQKVVEKRTQG